MPVTAKQIAEATYEDAELRPLLKGLEIGQVVRPAERFGIDQTEFSLQSGCIMRGMKVVVPKVFRQTVLADLHATHFGITRMKSLARSFCWWPGLDKDIIDLVQNCLPCSKINNNPPKVNPHHWYQPSRPFERIHVDFAGPFMGTYFLICIDAFSKWPEIHMLDNITTDKTIKILREIFSTFGLPQVLCTDNDAQFTNLAFQNFLKSNGIIHKRSAPYHPATNGQAERYVQTLKQKLRCLRNDKYDLAFKLQQILVHYRVTPHPTTGLSPSEALFKYPIRTKFSLMCPERKEKLAEYNTEIPSRKLFRGEKVACRNYTKGEKWKFGEICDEKGKLHYNVQLDDGRIWNRHIDQIRKVGNRIKDISFPSVPMNEPTSQTTQTISPANESTTQTTESSASEIINSESLYDHTSTPLIQNKDNDLYQKELPRRSGRTSKPPQRFEASKFTSKRK